MRFCVNERGQESGNPEKPSSSAYYSPLLDIGLSHSLVISAANSLLQIVTSPGQRASYTTFAEPQSLLKVSLPLLVIFLLLNNVSFVGKSIKNVYLQERSEYIQVVQ